MQAELALPKQRPDQPHTRELWWWRSAPDALWWPAVAWTVPCYHQPVTVVAIAGFVTREHLVVVEKQFPRSEWRREPWPEWCRAA